MYAIGIPANNRKSIQDSGSVSPVASDDVITVFIVVFETSSIVPNQVTTQAGDVGFPIPFSKACFCPGKAAIDGDASFELESSFANRSGFVYSHCYPDLVTNCGIGKGLLEFTGFIPGGTSCTDAT